jgi:hypothetical protein
MALFLPDVWAHVKHWAIRIDALACRGCGRLQRSRLGCEGAGARLSQPQQV